MESNGETNQKNQKKRHKVHENLKKRGNYEGSDETWAWPRSEKFKGKEKNETDEEQRERGANL